MVKWTGNLILTWTVLATLEKEHGSLIIISLMERAKMLIEEHLGLVIYQTQMKEREYSHYWLRLSREDTRS